MYNSIKASLLKLIMSLHLFFIGIKLLYLSDLDPFHCTNEPIQLSLIFLCLSTPSLSKTYIPRPTIRIINQVYINTVLKDEH